MTILIVAKDIGAANVVAPVGRLLVDAGRHVYGLAEGPAVERFRKNHLLCQEAYDVFGVPGAKALLRRLKPDAVVSGLSTPIHAEEAVGRAANEMGVRLVVIEDFWGAAARSAARPDVIVTIDKVGADHAASRYPASSIVAAGNPGARNVVVSSTTAEAIERLHTRYDRIFLFTESGPEAAHEQLALLVECLKRTSGNWCLIPSFHPKWRLCASRQGPTFGEIWGACLKPLGGRVEYVAAPGDELAAACDVTVSVYSTMLTVAAYNGRAAVSLDTPLSRANLKESSGGLAVAPQATLGYARLVSEPVDLADIRPSTVAVERYDPRTVLAVL